MLERSDLDDCSEASKLGKARENRGLSEGTQAHMMAMLHSRPDHIAMSTPLARRLLVVIGQSWERSSPGRCAIETEL